MAPDSERNQNENDTLECPVEDANGRGISLWKDDHLPYDETDRHPSYHKGRPSLADPDTENYGKNIKDPDRFSERSDAVEVEYEREKNSDERDNQ
jgi:hypothetical protein